MMEFLKLYIKDPNLLWLINKYLKAGVMTEYLKKAKRVPHNINMLSAFLHYVQRYLFKVLNRRSYKKSYTWDGYIDMLKVYPLAKPKIYVKLF